MSSLVKKDGFSGDGVFDCSVWTLLMPRRLRLRGRRPTSNRTNGRVGCAALELARSCSAREKVARPREAVHLMIGGGAFDYRTRCSWL